MSTGELLRTADVDRIFDACEDVGTMSYRYVVADALAAASVVQLGVSGYLTVRLTDKEVDSIFDPVQGANRESFRSGVARGVENLVRVRAQARQRAERGA